MADVRLDIVERLAGIGDAAQDLEPLLDEALDVLIDALEGAVGGAYVAEGPGGPLLHGRGPAGEALAARLREAWGETGRGAFPEEPCLLEATDADAADPSLAAVVAFSLRAREGTAGAVLLGFGPERPAESLELGLFRLVGRAVGLAIENARLAGVVRRSPSGRDVARVRTVREDGDPVTVACPEVVAVVAGAAKLVGAAGERVDDALLEVPGGRVSLLHGEGLPVADRSAGGVDLLDEHLDVLRREVVGLPVVDAEDEVRVHGPLAAAERICGCLGPGVEEVRPEGVLVGEALWPGGAVERSPRKPCA